LVERCEMEIFNFVLTQWRSCATKHFFWNPRFISTTNPADVISYAYKISVM